MSESLEGSSAGDSKDARNLITLDGHSRASTPDGDEDSDTVTLKLFGQARVLVAGSIIECPSEGEAQIEIIRKKGNANIVEELSETESMNETPRRNTIPRPPGILRRPSSMPLGRDTRTTSPPISIKSLVREGRDEGSMRDSDEVLTNPHPWEDSQRGTTVTIQSIGFTSATNSSTDSERSSSTGVYMSSQVNNSRDWGASDNVWEPVYSDEIEPSVSSLRSSRPPDAPVPGHTRYICENGPFGPVIHIENSSMPQMSQKAKLTNGVHIPFKDGSVADSESSDRRSKTMDTVYDRGYPAPLISHTFPPPRYPPGSYFAGVDGRHGNTFMPNPFTPDPVSNFPPLSPILPPAPFNSTDNINKNVSSVLSCTIGMMLWNEGLKFFPRTFSLDGEASLRKYVASTTSSRLRGPLMIIIDDWRPWNAQHLQQTFPTFPVRTLLSFNDHAVSSMLPLVNDNQDLTCITEHISVNSTATAHEKREYAIRLGDREAYCHSLFSWTTRSTYSGLLPPAQLSGPIPSQPLIVLISGPTAPVREKIIRYYLNSDPTLARWNRLAHDSEWIYLDMYFLFTKWDRVWGAVKNTLKERISVSQGGRSSLPILQQTHLLHQETNTMMSLQEHLRIHQASMERFELEINNTQLGAPVGRMKLNTRIHHTKQLFNYYNMTASSLLEQQQNLLSLAFNVETITQGQAVARLNALALVFLPLSFAASIFGMTMWTIEVQWYPVMALPLLAFTITVAVVVDKLLALHKMRHNDELQPSKLYYDIESRTPIGRIKGTLSKLAVSAKTLRSRKSKASVDNDFMFEKADSDSEFETVCGPYQPTYVEDTRMDDLVKKLDRLQSLNRLSKPFESAESASQHSSADESLRSFGSPLKTGLPDPPYAGVPGRVKAYKSYENRLKEIEEYQKKVTGEPEYYDIERVERAYEQEFTEKGPRVHYESKDETTNPPLTAERLRKAQPRERAAQSSIAKSQYSRGASEMGNIPSAFPRQKIDPNVIYLVTKKDGGSSKKALEILEYAQKNNSSRQNSRTTSILTGFSSGVRWKGKGKQTEGPLVSAALSSGEKEEDTVVLGRLCKRVSKTMEGVRECALSAVPIQERSVERERPPSPVRIDNSIALGGQQRSSSPPLLSTGNSTCEKGNGKENETKETPPPTSSIPLGKAKQKQVTIEEEPISSQ